MVSPSLVCGCNRLVSHTRYTGRVNSTAAVMNKHFSVLSTSLYLNNESNQQRHGAEAFFLFNASRSNKPLTTSIVNDRTVRSFGRKAGKMGQHLKSLDEMAHRDEHMRAKEKRKKKKGGKMKGDDSATSFTSSNDLEEIPALEEDEFETKFDNGDADDEEELPSLPSSDDVKSRMMKVVSAMEESFRSIRGAEPSPELFDAVQVKAYGTFTPLNSVAQVVITSPTLATLTCFDPETAPAVRDAVRDMAGMNFNPRIEDNSVIVPIPRVSAETRKVSSNKQQLI